MLKKILIISGAVIVMIGTLVFLVNYKNNQATNGGDNPYGKEDLSQATIDQMDDPDYQNQILPGELNDKLENGEDMFVYFYDSECSHCQELTPRLVPIAQNKDIDMKKFNLREFEDGWSKYNIEGTPTLVYFEDGQEVDRVNGAQPNDVFKQFFDEYAVVDTTHNKQAA